MTPKCHGSEDHACDQLEFLWGLADFCEDWVEQLHQLGLKNNRRTVQRIKAEVKESRKRKLGNNRGAETAAALLIEKTFHREAALEQDNSQWTGENRLLEPEEILRLDAADAAEMECLTDIVTYHHHNNHKLSDLD